MTEEGIPFEGQLTESEFHRIQWATTPVIVKWFRWVLVAALAVGFLSTGGERILREPAQQLPRLAALAVLELFALVAPRYLIRKAWATNASIRAPFSGRVTGEGVAWKNSLADAEFPWPSLHGYRQREGMLAIYLANRRRQSLLLLPRFFRSPDEWAAALALVTARLPAQ